MELLFIDAIVKATVLLATAALTAFMLRHASAASRHLVWTVAPHCGARTAHSFVRASALGTCRSVMLSRSAPAASSSASTDDAFQLMVRKLQQRAPDPAAMNATPGRCGRHAEAGVRRFQQNRAAIRARVGLIEARQERLVEREKHPHRGGLVDQLFNSSEKRLARILLLLARYGQADHHRTLPKISRSIVLHD